MIEIACYRLDKAKTYEYLKAHIAKKFSYDRTNDGTAKHNIVQNLLTKAIYSAQRLKCNSYRIIIMLPSGIGCGTKRN